MSILGSSLAVQWLRLCTLAARGGGSVPDWGTQTPQAMQSEQQQQQQQQQQNQYP